ncbi:MAG: DUF3795 domain-containing protein [Methanomassiliicoccales archaeon]
MKRETFERLREQMGPCGISCASCGLGNGKVGKVADKLDAYIDMYDIPDWAPQMPGGESIDFDALRSALRWLHSVAVCPGCEEGGGPPDCAIRACAREKGLELCSGCPDLSTCDKFEWLGGYADHLKWKLSQGKSKGKMIEEDLAGVQIDPGSI